MSEFSVSIRPSGHTRKRPAEDSVSSGESDGPLLVQAHFRPIQGESVEVHDKDKLQSALETLVVPYNQIILQNIRESIEVSRSPGGTMLLILSPHLEQPEKDIILEVPQVVQMPTDKFPAADGLSLHQVVIPPIASFVQQVAGAARVEVKRLLLTEDNLKAQGAALASRDRSMHVSTAPVTAYTREQRDGYLNSEDLERDGPTREASPEPPPSSLMQRIQSEFKEALSRNMGVQGGPAVTGTEAAGSPLKETDTVGMVDIPAATSYGVRSRNPQDPRIFSAEYLQALEYARGVIAAHFPAASEIVQCAMPRCTPEYPGWTVMTAITQFFGPNNHEAIVNIIHHFMCKYASEKNMLPVDCWFYKATADDATKTALMILGLSDEDSPPRRTMLALGALSQIILHIVSTSVTNLINEYVGNDANMAPKLFQGGSNEQARRYFARLTGAAITRTYMNNGRSDYIPAGELNRVDREIGFIARSLSLSLPGAPPLEFDI